jgi:hypothetical protein
MITQDEFNKFFIKILSEHVYIRSLETDTKFAICYDDGQNLEDIAFIIDYGEKTFWFCGVFMGMNLGICFPNHGYQPGFVELLMRNVVDDLLGLPDYRII